MRSATPLNKISPAIPLPGFTRLLSDEISWEGKTKGGSEDEPGDQASKPSSEQRGFWKRLFYRLVEEISRTNANRNHPSHIENSQADSQKGISPQAEPQEEFQTPNGSSAMTTNNSGREKALDAPSAPNSKARPNETSEFHGPLKEEARHFSVAASGRNSEVHYHLPISGVFTSFEEPLRHAEDTPLPDDLTGPTPVSVEHQPKLSPVEELTSPSSDGTRRVSDHGHTAHANSFRAHSPSKPDGTEATLSIITENSGNSADLGDLESEESQEPYQKRIRLIQRRRDEHRNRYPAISPYPERVHVGNTVSEAIESRQPSMALEGNARSARSGHKGPVVVHPPSTPWWKKLHTVDDSDASSSYRSAIQNATRTGSASLADDVNFDSPSRTI